MGRFLMLADDFTGAGDAGVQMTKHGIETHIVFQTDNIDSEKSYVIDCESRNISPKESYEKVRRIVSDLDKYPFEHYYKKIDSTLRGNIRDELVAMDEVLKPEIIVFNPGNPDSNRTVVESILMFNGVRVCETEIMRDPLSLVKEDNLKKLMESELQEPVRYFTLEEVRNGDFKLEGERIITFDVLENRDLDAVVNYVLRLGKKVLWVGSAGMANSLFSVLRPSYPVLSLIGSISETSRKQVQEAIRQGAQLVKLDVGKLLQGEPLQTVVDEAVEGLLVGHDVLVVSAKEHDDYLRAVEIGAEKGMKRGDVARFTQEKIGELSAMILKRAKVAGVFLTGGDTAISFTEKNHAHGATIIEEVLPIIAKIAMDGGDYPGLNCVVKGGSIGDEYALAESIKKLKNK